MRVQKLLTIGIIILFLSSLFLVSIVSGETGSLQSQIENANVVILSAFNQVLKAEAAGANNTDLIDELNVAADLLAQAQNAQIVGDNQTALNCATSALRKAQNIFLDAQKAQETAILAKQNSLTTTIAFVIIASFLFMAGLFLVWRIFKRHYITNILDSEVKVSDN